MKGIDVAKYQGDINWQKVKSAGIEFAFIRAGWAGYEGGIDEGKDPYFEKNMAGAIAAGIHVGAYVYSYCKTEAAAKKAAAQVLELCKPYALTMPIAFDIEADDSTPYQGFSKAKNSAICKAFLDEIRQNGAYPILYTYKAFVASYLDMNVLKDYDFWLAHYDVAKSDYAGPYTIWQYTSKGTVDGIEGRVDMNEAYVDYPALIAGPKYGEKIADEAVVIRCKATGSDQKRVIALLEELGIGYFVDDAIVTTTFPITVGDQRRLTGLTDPLGINWNVVVPQKEESNDIPAPVEDTDKKFEEIREQFEKTNSALNSLIGVIQSLTLQINKLDAQMQTLTKKWLKSQETQM